jgi:hypothetical protein
MNDLFGKSRELLTQWKGKNYVFGRGVMPELGNMAAAFGKNALVVCNTTYMKVSPSDASDIAIQYAKIFNCGPTYIPKKPLIIFTSVDK